MKYFQQEEPIAKTELLNRLTWHILLMQFPKQPENESGRTYQYTVPWLLQEQELETVAKRLPRLPSISTTTVCARSAASSRCLHVLRALSSRSSVLVCKHDSFLFQYQSAAEEQRKNVRHQREGQLKRRI